MSLISGAFSHAEAKEYFSGPLYKNVREEVELKHRDMLFRQTQTDSSMSVFTRKQSEYDPLNIRIGSLLLEPSVSTSYSHVDNIYETASNKISGNVLSKEAGLKIKSDFVRHLIGFEANIEDGTFIKRSSENYRDYKLGLAARADISTNLSIPFEVKSSKEHVKRDDVEDTDGVTPTIVHTSSLQSGLKYVGGVIGFLYNAIISKFSYHDNILADGTPINNSDRDRIEITNSLIFNGVDSGRVSPFAFLDLKKVDYNNSVDDFGLNRDSHGWVAGLGSNVTFSGLTSGIFRYGKMGRSFDDPSFNSVSEQFYGVDIVFEPTTLLGLNLSGQRYIDESALSNASVSINSSLGLKATYEFAPNIYLYPEIKYLLKDYQSTDNREVERLSKSLKMSYKMNRNIWGTASFENSVQDEKRDGFSPTHINVNKVLFSLKFQL